MLFQLVYTPIYKIYELIGMLFKLYKEIVTSLIALGYNSHLMSTFQHISSLDLVFMAPARVFALLLGVTAIVSEFFGFSLAF